MRKILLFLSCAINTFVWSQQSEAVLGIVENENTQLSMETVHVLNLTQVIGTTTDRSGKFELPAALNDTL